MNILTIPQNLYHQIVNTIGASPTESGGIFAVSDDGMITKYYFDIHTGTGKRFYRPSALQITAQVNNWLQEPGLYFGGFIHSHPAGQITLSPMDIVAAEMTIYRNALSWIYMLILCEDRIIGYRITPQQGLDHAAVEPCSVRITA